MQALLLSVHVTAMSVSILLTLAALLLGLLKRPALASAAKAALFATIVGAVSGAVMLLFAPAAAQCIELSLYLFGFGLVYVFVFGRGHAERSLFLRR